MTAPWLDDLRRRLESMVSYEMEVTAQIAVCIAAKMNNVEIVRTLGCTDLDIKMARQRLQGVAEQWTA